MKVLPSSMVMAPQLYCLACLVAFVEFQCHAFKPLNQRSTLSGDLLRSRDYCTWRRSSSSPLLYSIRGGSSEQEIEDENDEDDSYYDFISSFESELAEIRREAELEAENEMKKLLGLVDSSNGTVNDTNEEEEEDEEDHDGETEIIEPEYQGDTDGLNESDQYEGVEGGSDVPLEESIEARPDEEETNESTSDNDILLHSDESINQQDIGSDDEDKVEEENDEELKDDKVDVQDERDMIVGISESVDVTVDSTEPLGTSMDDSTTERENIGSSRKMKPKLTKKKSKAHKRKKKKVKARIDLAVESDMADGGQVDIGESLLLTRTRGNDEEVAQPHQSGIWYYLRSDLGRALCLFIATIIVAILTKRLERQMEAEGAI
ncbi:hypothetical protein ACHAXH_003714 [Discostella pseudostelligera]